MEDTAFFLILISFFILLNLRNIKYYKIHPSKIKKSNDSTYDMKFKHFISNLDLVYKKIK